MEFRAIQQLYPESVINATIPNVIFCVKRLAKIGSDNLVIESRVIRRHVCGEACHSCNIQRRRTDRNHRPNRHRVRNHVQVHRWHAAFVASATNYSANCLRRLSSPTRLSRRRSVPLASCDQPLIVGNAKPVKNCGISYKNPCKSEV